MNQSIGALFGSSHTVMDEVSILEVGNHKDGVYNFPAGYVLDDFECFELAIRTQPDSVKTARGTQVIPKKSLVEGAVIQLNASTSGTTVACDLLILSQTQFQISSAGNSEYITYITGKTKQYITNDGSKILTVNNGGDITPAQRYEIDIASALGQEYLGKNLIVRAEIYVEGVTYSGYGESTLASYFSGAGNDLICTGVYAEVEGDKIVVYTAGYGTQGASSKLLLYKYHTNKWGMNGKTNIAAAPCRIKVWKSDYAAPATYNGGAGKTTLWEGSPTLGAVILSDSVLNYDAILLEGLSWADVAVSAFASPDVLIKESFFGLGSYTAGHDVYVVCSAANTAKLTVYKGGNAEGLLKVTGIKYS